MNSQKPLWICPNCKTMNELNKPFCSGCSKPSAIYFSPRQRVVFHG